MKLSLSVVILLCSPLLGHAATINAASCSLANVNTAIASASDGDTVQIPACGSTTWASAVSTSKGITIQGAGIGVTTINNNGFDMNVPDGKSWRITAMTLTGSACVNALTESKAWRVDHIRFDTVSPGDLRCANRLIWVGPTGPGYQKGLIDHNTFIDPGAIQIHMRASGDGGNGEYIRALGLGTDDSVVIEDNSFLHSTLQVSDPVTDCDGGGRLTFRHNTIQNSYFEMHDAIVPGFRSCRKYEVYNNTFSMTYDSGQFVFVGIRGGTGVIHDNTFTTNGFFMGAPVVVALYRTGQTDSDPWDILCQNTTSSDKARLAGTSPPAGCTSGTDCIRIDGTGSPAGYPCRDQFGFDGNNPQVSQPVLFWNNKKDGAQTNDFDFNGPSTPSTYIVENRDWCRSNTSSPPSSCNGVTTTYVDFTYPHPLISGGGGGGSTAGGGLDF